MRCRASLQARTRAAKTGRALKCGAEPGRGGASGEETGRWAEATANGLACGSRGFEAGRQWLELRLEEHSVRGYAPGRRARGEKDSPVFIVPRGGKELAQRRWVGLKRWHVLGCSGVSCFPLAKISKSMNYAQEFVNTKSVEGI